MEHMEPQKLGGLVRSKKSDPRFGPMELTDPEKNQRVSHNLYR